MVTVSDKNHMLQQLGAENCWHQIKSSWNESRTEVVEQKERKHKTWMTPETLKKQKKTKLRADFKHSKPRAIKVCHICAVGMLFRGVFL